MGTTLAWPDLHRRACHEAKQSWSSYTDAGVRLVLGEWSLATNHDAPLDLGDKTTVEELKRLFREQLEVFTTTDGVIGSFFWTLRMGSGWDPRPSGGAPHGAQAAGTTAWRSKKGYPFQVWSLLEMARVGVVTRLDADVRGACADQR